MGEPTTMLDEEMLESSPGRATVESTLRGLLARGLVRTERATNYGEQVYEDDWWIVTEAGRVAIGLSPKPSKPYWINPIRAVPGVAARGSVVRLARTTRQTGGSGLVFADDRTTTDLLVGRRSRARCRSTK